MQPQGEDAVPADNRPRWRRRSEARPGEILDAALDLFAEKGFAGTRMEEIARRAGVTKGTVYLYYPGKEDIFRAVVQESVIPSLQQAERLVAEHTGDSASLMRGLLLNWWERYGSLRMAGMAKLLMAEAGNFPELSHHYAEAVILRARRLFVSVLQRGMDAGEFRPLPALETARLAIAPLAHAAAYARSLAAFDPDPVDLGRYLELHIDIFLRGIAAEAPRSDA